MEFIGLALGALTMIPFLFPAGQDMTAPGRTTVVRIGAGISSGGNGDTSMMGSIPGIALFDVGGIKIGQADIDEEHAKAWQDISILTDDDIQDPLPEYISLSAGKDAICIAYVIVTTSAQNKYIWTGDIAKACGVPTYYTPPQFNQPTDGYLPACMWLNGDPHIKGAIDVFVDGTPLQFRGMGMHITDFSAPSDAAAVPNSITTNQATAYGSNHDLFCNSAPRFWMYDALMPDDYIPYFVGGLQYKNGVDEDADKVLNSAHWAIQTAPPVTPTPDVAPAENTKRGLPIHTNKQNGNWIYNSTQMHQEQRYRERVVRNNITEMNLRSAHINANIMKDHLVTSNEPSHSATELCNDPSTAGPDFVSLTEQVYCDMSIKKTLPLCTPMMQGPCFDMSTHKFRPGPQAKRDANRAVKNYVKVINW